MQKGRFAQHAEIRPYTPPLQLRRRPTATTSRDSLSLTLGDILTRETIETSLSRYLPRSPDPALVEMIGDLVGTVVSNDYDEDDFLRPTDYSINTLWEVLVGAGQQVKSPIPLGSVVADGNGGLRVEWIRSSGEVRLVVAPGRGGKSYIYHECGGKYSVHYNPSAQKLSSWLNLLATNE